jgi:hypothetical protein
MYEMSSDGAVRMTTNDSVVLHGVPTGLSTAEGRALVAECVRAAHVVTDADVQARFEIAPADWIDISQNKTLIRSIQLESDRRTRDGSISRELAAKYHVKAVSALDEIVSDKAQSARHRTDAARELRAAAAGGNTEAAVNNAEKFLIVLNLGADVERYPLASTNPLPPPNRDKEQADGSGW